MSCLDVNYGLVKLYPLGETTISDSVFFRVLGSTTSLAYVIDFLAHGDRMPKAIHSTVLRSIDTIISALDRATKEEPEYPFVWKTVVTIRNYASASDLDADYVSLNQRFQKYKGLMDRISSGARLTKEEEVLRVEFLEMAKFFRVLEEDRSAWKFQTESDDE